MEKSQLKTLWELGMFRPYDLAILGLLGLTAMATLFWRVFSPAATWHGFLAAALVSLLLFQLWLVSLAYRCIWFVIKVWGDIKNLPNDAAKLTLAFTRGTK
jgi:uncharacterized membrane protein